MLLARDPSRAPSLTGVEVRRADYSHSEDTRRALTGVDTLLMVSASETPDRVERHLAFIDAASAAGVGHVVYTSFQGAAPAATFTWRATTGPRRSTCGRAGWRTPSCATACMPTSCP